MKAVPYPRIENYRSGLAVEYPILQLNEEGELKFRNYNWNFDERKHYVQDLKSINYGNVEILKIKVLRYRIDPMATYNTYCGPREFKFTFQLKMTDKEGAVLQQEIETDNSEFMLKNTIPFINILLEEGHSINDFDWDWINWQANTGGDDQGKWFPFKKNDIRNGEELYDFLSSFTLAAQDYYTSRFCGRDGYITFKYIDDYISNLINDALRGFIRKDTENNTICIEFKIYCNESQYYYINSRDDVRQEEIEQYVDPLIKKLRVHCLMHFDEFEVKKSKFLKSKIRIYEKYEKSL